MLSILVVPIWYSELGPALSNFAHVFLFIYDLICYLVSFVRFGWFC